MYKYLSGKVESPQTIVLDKERKHFCRLEGSERRNFAEVVVVLTMALIGENDYFFDAGNYINSSMTELHFQNFSCGEEWVAFTSRKRDGSCTDMGYKYGKVTITKPRSCGTGGGCREVNQRWLDCLGKVLQKSNRLDRIIIEACDLFAQANTDEANRLVNTEVVALANAFDRLFPEADGTNKLAEAVSCTLRDWESIRVECSKHLQEKKIKLKEIYKEKGCKDINNWSLIKFWVFKLYTLRNYYVHGKSIEQHSWAWSEEEHLLLGAFIFPLLVKVRLMREGRYEMEKEDCCRLAAFEELLDLMVYWDKEAHKSPWQETILRKRWGCSAYAN
jgi:hypothetical protein